MIGWSFFFMLVGVSTLASQVFRVVDYIEQPAATLRRGEDGRSCQAGDPDGRSQV